MVQILPPKTNLGSQIGSAFGQGFQSGSNLGNQVNLQQLLQQRQQSMLQSSLDRALQNYSAPGMSQESKLVGLYRDLAANPQVAQALAGNLQKMQQQQQSMGLLQHIFGGGQPQAGGQNEAMQGQNPEVSKGPASSMSDASIAAVALFNPVLAKVLQQQKDASLQRELTEKKRGWELEDLARKEETDIAKPILLELNQVRKNIPYQEQAIEDIKEASPNVGWRDFVADLVGAEPLRTAEGARLKTAIKDFFLSDLTRAGARPNQWMEQQLADALPKIGRSKEANLITAEGLKFKVDLAKKRMEIIDKLAEDQKKRHGYVKGDIDSLSYNMMKPYVRERQKELKTAIEEIKKAEKSTSVERGFKRMTNPETGEMYDIPIQDVNEARKAGWREQ